MASLEEILEKMETRVIEFRGDPGTGKTTTLIEAYYHAKSKNMNAAFINLQQEYSKVNKSIPDDIYLFVDNAQLFRSKIEYAQVFMYRKTHLCLTYSGKGVDFRNPDVKASDFVMFTPFSQKEWLVYKEKSNIKSWDAECESFIPGLLSLSNNRPSVYDTLVLEQVYLEYFNKRLTNDPKFVFNVYSCIFGTILDETDWISLKLHGWAYYSEECKKYKLFYGNTIMAQFYSKIVKQFYEILSSFNKGAATEIWFSSSCRANTIEVKCDGVGNSIGGDKMQSTSFCLTCTKFVTQNELNDKVEITPGATTLIQLAERHFAVDFLILDDAGKSLYFIQVSSQRYQDRSTKLEAVKNKTKQFDSPLSPLQHYSNMFGVAQKYCVYVFSSPKQSYLGIDKDSVYVHQLM